MKKKIIIFGTNQFAEIMYYHLVNDDYEVSAFTVNAQYYHEKFFLGIPVIAFENIGLTYPKEEFAIMVCIGYGKMNTVRQRVFCDIKTYGYEIADYRHPSAVVLSHDIGEGNIILEGAIIGLCCKIGVGNVFYAQTHIAHHTTVGNYNFFAISSSIAGNVSIYSNCFFGNNCTVRNGIKISNYTLIGAAGYVDQDTEEYGVYVPPRTIKLDNKNSININL